MTLNRTPSQPTLPPDPSLEPTRYGSRRLAAPGQADHRPSATSDVCLRGASARTLGPVSSCGFATSLHASCFGSQRAPQFHSLLGPRLAHARCRAEEVCAGALVRFRARPPGRTRLASAKWPSHTYPRPVPPPHRSRPPERRAGCQRRRSLLLRRILATRCTRPPKCRMVCTPATCTWPNPSNERTSSSRLRRPTAAAHVER